MIEHEPLAKHTSWRIGGPARYYLEVRRATELQPALQWAHERSLPVFVLGGGTNLLVRESGFPGLVLRYRAQTWHVQSQDAAGVLYVEAGAPMAGTVRRVAGQGWGGLEWAEGLPGTVGGAIYGNAGCYGGDIAGVLIRIWLLIENQMHVWPVERLAYGYRTSTLKAADQRRTADNLGPGDHGDGRRMLQPVTGNPPIVVAAEFRVTRRDPSELAEVMARIARERKARTPWGSTCGSVFRNPQPQGGSGATLPSAGQLIDQAGLKGMRMGAAEISRHHGNYIVNLGGASSDDVLRLIDLARETVLREFGIGLELEIQLLG